MFHKKVPAYQLAAWLFMALSAPVAQIAGRDGWLPVLVCGAVGLGLSFCISRIELKPETVRWMLFPAFAVVCVVLGELSYWSMEIWPTNDRLHLVPLALLLLAVLASMHGGAVAAKACSVLFWFVAILYGIILIAGGSNIVLERLEPVWNMPSAFTVIVMLVPAVILFLPRQEGKMIGFWGIGIFALLLSIWTVGALSGSAVQKESWPFYVAAKSVSVFTVAQRLEAFVSAASTLGYFGVYCLLLSAAGHMAEYCCKGWGRVGVGAAAGISALYMLTQVRLNLWIVAIFLIVIWGLFPMILSLKKIRKNEEKQLDNG